MKSYNTFALVISALIWGLVSPSRAHTHLTPPLQPELIASDDLAFSLAKIWFLPDYQGSEASRTSSDSGGGSAVPEACETYGLLADCDSPRVPEGSKVFGNLTCYESCVCPERFRYTDTSCGAGYTAGNSLCDGLADSCVGTSCPAGSSATSCDTDRYTQTITGKSGSSNCYQCAPKACPSGSAVNKSCDDSKYKRVAAGYSGADTCYRCEDKGCPSGSSATACDTANYTATVVGYSGTQTCYQCTPKGCPTSLSCEYGCQTYDNSRQNMCGSVCAECKTCVKTDCAAFPLAAAPANAAYETCKPGCGDETPRYKIKSCNSGYELKNGACRSDTCPAGYAKTACAENQLTNGTKYTDFGSPCYACKDKACEDYNVSFTPTAPVGSYQDPSLVYETVDPALVGGLTCYSARTKGCEDFAITYTPTFSTAGSDGHSCVQVDPDIVSGRTCYDCQIRNCPVGEVDDMHGMDCVFGVEDPDNGWYKPVDYGTDNKYYYCALCNICPEGYQTMDYAEGYEDRIFSPNFGVYCYKFASSEPYSCPAGYTHSLCRDIICKVDPVCYGCGSGSSKAWLEKVQGTNTNLCFRCTSGYLYCNDLGRLGPI